MATNQFAAAENSQTNQPLNAAQLARVQDEMQKIVAGMQLRKWAVEQAKELGVAANGDDFIHVAAQIYDFVSKP